MATHKNKSAAVADPIAVRSNDVINALQANAWLPVRLRTLGRNYNITEMYAIYDQVDDLCIYGLNLEDNVKLTSDTLETVTHANTAKALSEINIVRTPSESPEKTSSKVNSICDHSEDAKKISSVINSISDLPVIKDMRIPESSINIALDTEYYVDDCNQRHILSWQFCFIKNLKVYRVIVFPKSEQLLDFNKLLSFLIDYYDLYEPFVERGGLKFKDYRRWEVPELHKGKEKKVICNSFEEAISRCCNEEIKNKLIELGPNAKAEYGKNKEYHEGYFYNNESNKYSIPITLCMHFSPADLTTFGISDDYGIDILKHCSYIQGGLVTLKPVHKKVKNNYGYQRFYPITLSVRDTMCYAPDGKKSLDSLGETIGLGKVELPTGYAKDRMQDFLLGEPGLFVEYATRDTVITIFYASFFNTLLPWWIQRLVANRLLL